MFHLFKNKEFIIGAPVKGKAVPISTVSDPTFGDEILGKGIAIKPDGGSIVAPVDGEISVLFDTMHAFSMTSAEGIEILVHIGLETVSLKGEPFKAHVKTGDKVNKGDLIISVDWDTIEAAGLETITPIVVCNTDNFAKVESLTENDVLLGDDILKVVIK